MNNASSPCRQRWPRWLHVDDSRQLLDSVQQQVALLDGFLVLPVFAIRSRKKTRKSVTVLHLVISSSTDVWRIVTLPIGFHNLIHFINFTVETAGSYESGEFPEEREEI